MLKMRLELVGDCEVLAAEDGEKGCEMAAAERPDIILMDLENAGCRRLGSHSATKEQSANPRHPCYRSLRTCARRRAPKGARRGVQRVRQQADRIWSAGRNRSAHSRRAQMTLSDGTRTIEKP